MISELIKTLILITQFISDAAYVRDWIRFDKIDSRITPELKIPNKVFIQERAKLGLKFVTRSNRVFFILQVTRLE